MRFVVIGATGTVGRAAAAELSYLCGPDDSIILAARNRKRAEALAAELAPSSSTRLSTATACLPAAPDEPVLNEADAVLCCAGPAVHLANDLARRCIEHSIAYVDVGGSRRLLETLDKPAREGAVPVLLGAGVQPGLLGAMIRRAGRNGSQRIVVHCGGRQRLTRAGAEEYLASLSSDFGWPSSYWLNGSIVASRDDPGRTVLPSLYGSGASRHLHLDEECADTARELALTELVTYNVIGDAATASALRAVIAGEMDLDGAIMATSPAEPVFAIHVVGEQNTLDFSCTDSYAVSGRIAARTVRRINNEAPGARWASASPVCEEWLEELEVRSAPTVPFSKGTGPAVTYARKPERDDRPRVIVIGCGFGAHYARALARRESPARLVGVVGKGGARSKALSEELTVPLLPDPISTEAELAVVAVSSDMIGGPGTDIARDLLERGIRVIQEHPVDGRIVAELTRTARDGDSVYLPTGFYEYLDSSHEFVRLCTKLRTNGRLTHIEARTSIQLLERCLLILAEAVGAAPTTSPVIAATSSPERVLVSGFWGSTPIDLMVHNRWDPKDPDNNCQPDLHAVVTSLDGELRWDHVHGSLHWLPRMHLTAGYLHDPDSPLCSALGTDEPVHAREILERLWPTAIQRALTRLIKAPAGHPQVNQRALQTLSWWSRLRSAMPIPTPITSVEPEPLKVE